MRLRIVLDRDRPGRYSTRRMRVIAASIVFATLLSASNAVAEPSTRTVAATRPAELGALPPSDSLTPHPVGRMPTGADPQVSNLEEAIDGYFAGEKAEGWVFLGFGVAAAGAGTAFFFSGDDTLRGASYPVVGISLIQIAAGVVLLLRTDGQVAKLKRDLQKRPGQVKNQELDRMRKVNREFGWLKIAETSLFAGGVALAAAGSAKNSPVTSGVGAGLAAQSAAMLWFDLFAERRAQRYTDVLERPALPPVAISVGSVF